MTDLIIPIILCGGSGTRLWPASRENTPKQLLSLMGGQSLLRETLDRAHRITGAPAERVVAVTLQPLEPAVRAQLGECVFILSEPSARNTAAAIALAALHVQKTFGDDALLWVLPSDHHIGDDDALGTAVRQGTAAAAQGSIVTFGIRATRPETSYGYIAPAGAADESGVFRVAQFIEKPDAATAQSYVATGTYLWNSGMVLARAGTVLDQFSLHAPAILNATLRAARRGTDKVPDAVLYADVTAQPFDKAILERSADVVVVPCDPQWSDVGSWDSVWAVQGKDSNDNVVQGNVVSFDTRGSLIQGSGSRLIACAGLENVVIVDTGDAVLVANKNDPDAMKGLVKALEDARQIKTNRGMKP